MLQDEMFQQQAREMLGDNFMNEAYGPGGAPSGRQASSRTQPAGGAPAQPQPDLGILKALNSMGSAAKRNLSQLAQGFNSGGSSGNAQTSSRGGFGGGSPAPARSGSVRRGSGSGRKKGAFDDLDDVSIIMVVFHHLYPFTLRPQSFSSSRILSWSSLCVFVCVFLQDEEGTEIITFSGTEGGSRSRHMLQNDGAPGSNNDGDDDDDLDGANDSENPLLQYKSTNNVSIGKK